MAEQDTLPAQPQADIDDSGHAWPWLRWPLLAAVVLSWGLALVSTPLPAGEGRFGADLAAGKVRSYTLGDPQFLPVIQPWSGDDDRRGVGHVWVTWRASSGLRYQADLQSVATSGVDGDVVQSDGVVGGIDGTATIRRTATDHAQPPPRETASATSWTGRVAWSVVVWLVCVWLLVVGPQPRRATKWGWFWRLGLPLGVGQIWWLLGEAPWSRATTERPEPPPHARLAGRSGGWGNFFAALLLGSLLVSVGGLAVRSMIGSPRGPVTFTVVHDDGSVTPVELLPDR